MIEMPSSTLRTTLLTLLLCLTAELSSSSSDVPGISQDESLAEALLTHILYLTSTVNYLELHTMRDEKDTKIKVILNLSLAFIANTIPPSASPLPHIVS